MERLDTSIGKAIAAIALSVVACFSTFPHALGARASENDAPRAMKGVTVIRSTQTSRMTVNLSRPAEISVIGFGTALSGPQRDDLFHAENPDVSISGNGRVTGIALVATEPEPSEERTMLLAANLRFCDSPACFTEEDPYFYLAGFMQANAGRYLIPAGNYLLYTITDGAPITVKLRLHGLEGKTRLTPAPTTDAIGVRTPPDSLSEPVTGVAHSYGETYDFAGDEGLLLTALRLRGARWAYGKYGLCLYNGEPTTPSPGAYAYPCAGGFGVYIDDANARIDPYQNLFHTAIHVGRDGGGSWSLGGAYAAQADIERFDFVQLHIHLPKEEIETIQSTRSCVRAPTSSGSGSCIALPRSREKSLTSS